MKRQFSGYRLHWATLLFEAFGSLLVFLEARRMSAQLEAPATSTMAASLCRIASAWVQDW